MPLIRRPHLSGLLVLLSGLFLLSCEDPSGVGLTVVDFGETDPSARVIPVDVELDTLIDLTGDMRPSAGAFLGRFLAGRTADPLFGTIEADGYIGFLSGQSMPSSYISGTVDEAILDLHANYVFGDTTSAATFDLYEIDEQWSALTFRSDSTLRLEDEPIASFQIAPADTLVSLNLPDEWVARRDSLMRQASFGDDFHGFAIRARPENQMVVGFSGQTRLLGIRIINPGNNGEMTADTVIYPSLQTASSIERDLATANPPQELFPLQDGAGDGVYLNMRLDTLETHAIAGGFVRIDADTLLLEQNQPPNFVRPLARSLALYGLRDGPPTVLADGRFDPQASSYTFASTELNVVLHDMLLDRSVFDRLAIGFHTRPSSVNVAPLIQDTTSPPRIVLIVSPTD